MNTPTRDLQKSYVDKRRKPIEFSVGDHVLLKVSPWKVPLDEIRDDDRLNFMEEPVEIMEREFQKLKQSRIAIVKVRWNSKREPKFTWKHKDHMKLKRWVFDENGKVNVWGYFHRTKFLRNLRKSSGSLLLEHIRGGTGYAKACFYGDASECSGHHNGKTVTPDKTQDKSSENTFPKPAGSPKRNQHQVAVISNSAA
ncbi:hypothetical protein Tco_0702902 [Tanacetum coccineum]|uniref:Reverse transcriptase domain-containing protein n=1 Tax=Tanacetum coccineum TaxID=301880 RepID=A0ABQ4XXW4_9ASTR